MCYSCCTVGADVNPLPDLITSTDCMTSFNTTGSKTNNEP